MAGRSSVASSHRLRTSAMPGEVATLQHYRLGREIGRGGFGVVFEALDTRTGQSVAIKRLSLANMTPEDLPSIEMEIDLLKRLHHPNIVAYIGSFRTREYLYIVLELVEGGSLLGIVKRFGVLSEQLAAVYVIQILKGLQYLHEQGIMHRDIKAANVLCTKLGIAKLTDFGVSSEINVSAATGTGSTAAPGAASSSAAAGASGHGLHAGSGAASSEPSVRGSPYWLAPEVIEMAAEASPASDIWSLGATIIELLTGVPPYYNLPPMSALFHIVTDDAVPMPEGVALSPACLDFLSGCFRKSPHLRATSQELLRHPWLAANVAVTAATDGEVVAVSAAASALRRRGGGGGGGGVGRPMRIAEGGAGGDADADDEAGGSDYEDGEEHEGGGGGDEDAFGSDYDGAYDEEGEEEEEEGGALLLGEEDAPVDDSAPRKGSRASRGKQQRFLDAGSDEDAGGACLDHDGEDGDGTHHHQHHSLGSASAKGLASRRRAGGLGTGADGSSGIAQRQGAADLFRSPSAGRAAGLKRCASDGSTGAPAGNGMPRRSVSARRGPTSASVIAMGGVRPGHIRRPSNDAAPVSAGGTPSAAVRSPSPSSGGAAGSSAASALVRSIPSPRPRMMPVPAVSSSSSSAATTGTGVSIASAPPASGVATPGSFATPASAASAPAAQAVAAPPAAAPTISASSSSSSSHHPGHGRHRLSHVPTTSSVRAALAQQQRPGSAARPAISSVPVTLKSESSASGITLAERRASGVSSGHSTLTDDAVASVDAGAPGGGRSVEIPPTPTGAAAAAVASVRTPASSGSSSSARAALAARRSAGSGGAHHRLGPSDHAEWEATARAAAKATLRLYRDEHGELVAGTPPPAPSSAATSATTPTSAAGGVGEALSPLHATAAAVAASSASKPPAAAALAAPSAAGLAAFADDEADGDAGMAAAAARLGAAGGRGAAGKPPAGATAAPGGALPAKAPAGGLHGHAVPPALPTPHLHAVGAAGKPPIGGLAAFADNERDDEIDAGKLRAPTQQQQRVHAQALVARRQTLRNSGGGTLGGSFRGRDGSQAIPSLSINPVAAAAAAVGALRSATGSVGTPGHMGGDAAYMLHSGDDSIASSDSEDWVGPDLLATAGGAAGGAGGGGEDMLSPHLAAELSKISAAELKKRLQARLAGARTLRHHDASAVLAGDGAQPVATAATPASTTAAAGGSGGGSKAAGGSSADGFSLFDATDFVIDARVERARALQREVAALVERMPGAAAEEIALAHKAAAGTPVSTPVPSGKSSAAAARGPFQTVIARLLQLFSAHPSLRAHLVRRHGVLNIVDALHLHKGEPRIIAPLLRLLNAMTQGAPELLESLALVGVLPAALQFTDSQYATPVRAEAATFVRLLVTSSTGNRKMLAAVGGVYVAVGLLLPSRVPRKLLTPPSARDSPVDAAMVGSPVVPAAAATPAAAEQLQPDSRLEQLWRLLGLDASLTPTHPGALVVDVEGLGAGAGGESAGVLRERVFEWLDAESSLVATACQAIDAVLQLHAAIAGGTAGATPRAGGSGPSSAGDVGSNGGGGGGGGAPVMTGNEFRRLFIRAGLLEPVAEATRATFLYICAQATDLMTAMMAGSTLISPAVTSGPGSPLAASIGLLRQPWPLHGYSHLQAADVAHMSASSSSLSLAFPSAASASGGALSALQSIVMAQRPDGATAPSEATAFSVAGTRQPASGGAVTNAQPLRPAAGPLQRNAAQPSTAPVGMSASPAGGAASSTATTASVSASSETSRASVPSKSPPVPSGLHSANSSGSVLVHDQLVSPQSVASSSISGDTPIGVVDSGIESAGKDSPGDLTRHRSSNTVIRRFADDGDAFTDTDDDGSSDGEGSAAAGAHSRLGTTFTNAGSPPPVAASGAAAAKANDRAAVAASPTTDAGGVARAAAPPSGPARAPASHHGSSTAGGSDVDDDDDRVTMGFRSDLRLSAGGSMGLSVGGGLTAAGGAIRTSMTSLASVPEMTSLPHHRPHGGVLQSPAYHPGITTGSGSLSPAVSAAMGATSVHHHHHHQVIGALVCLPTTLPPHLTTACDNLTKLADVLVSFAQGDSHIKVALAQPRIVAALLRIVRPAPSALLHHPCYAPTAARVLKALRHISGDPQAVEVMDACGAIPVLVHFLVRETGILGNTPAPPGAATAASSATLSGVSGGSPPGTTVPPAPPASSAAAAAASALPPASILHSKDVQSYVLHALFNMCRVSRPRQNVAAAHGIVPALVAVISTSSPLKSLALPLLCDLAHAGAKARRTLWDADAAPVFVQLLHVEYWGIHALSSLAEWAAADAARIQTLLLAPASQEALVSLLRSTSMYTDAVIPALTTLCDRCPPLARALGTRADCMTELVRRLSQPALASITIKHLCALLRSILLAADAIAERRALVARWSLAAVISAVADEAKRQGKVIVAPITDALLRLCELDV